MYVYVDICTLRELHSSGYYAVSSSNLILRFLDRALYHNYTI